MKRTLSLFLALIFAVGICFSAPVTITASAAFTLESGTEHTVGAVYIDSTTGVKFKITDIETKQVEVCGYDSSPTNLEIPATVTINENEYSVTTIGDSAFDSCEALATVTIPDSVTTIGNYTFNACTALATVTIGKGVTTIGDYAFNGCEALATVNVPCSWEGETAGGKTVTKYHTGTLGTPEPTETEDGKQHVATYDCCGTVVIENHDYNNERICTKCGNPAAWFTGTKVNDDFSVTFFVECDDHYFVPWDQLQLEVYNGDQLVGGLNIADGQQGYYATMTELNPDCKGITLTADLIIQNYYNGHEKTRTTVEVKNPNNHDTTKTATCISKAECSVCGEYGDFAPHTYENGKGKCTVANCDNACAHETITDDDVCTTCGGKYCGADKTEDKVVWFYDEYTDTLTITGSGAMVGEGFEGGEVPWLIDYTNSIGKIDIEYGVTSIGNLAFCGCDNLTSVTIPKSVKEIGFEAFEACFELTSVTIPEGVTAIGSKAFYYCTKLTSVTIPKSVTEIGNNAFYGCTNILLFVDENNTDVKDYATTNNINYVVDGSGELEKLTFTPIYKEADNENSEITGYSVTARDKTISGALTIPSEFNGKPVTKIGYGAFANCENLTSVVIPDSVVSLGEMAFYVCEGLETVTLSSNITVITNDAFAYCHSLKTLPITENITSIGERAFYDSGEHGSVSLSGVTIGSEAFRSCGITELILENCELNDTDIFTNNDIEELVLLETDVPDEMFYGDSYIKTLVAENSVLGSKSFKSCQSLKSVTVFGGEINAEAFLACSSLETVTIDNIDSVGKFAFNNCQALKTVEVNAKEISEYAFSMCTSLESVKLSDGVEVIGDAVFECCDSLAELELPETVKKIGKWVFNGCDLLTELVIPESVTDVSAEAFAGCFNLKYVFFVGDEEDIGNEYIADAKIHYGSSTHTFEENYTVDLDPTCTEKGRESQHCKYCEETENSKEIKELGHTSVKGGTEKAHTICDVCEEVLSATHNPTSKVTTAPTCTEEGVETFTCECGYTYTKPVATLGHDIVIDKAVEATCTATGLTEGSHCSRCNGATVAQQTIAKKAHTEVAVTGKAATCTSTGLTDGKKCSVCGTTIVAQQVIPATGHTITVIGKKDATTKEAGYTGDKVCSVCNAEIEKGKEIPKIIVSLATPTVTIKNTAKGISVNWNAIENAESYIVYRSIYNASTKKWSKWGTIKTVVTDVSCVDTTVKLGTIYKYTVRAVNGDVKSSYVGTKALKYNVVPTVKIANTSAGVKVAWSTAANATGYTVYRSQYNTKTKKWSVWKNMGTAKANKTSWVDKKVTSGVSYKYTVRAANGKILSSYKSSASLMFLSQPTVKFANASTGVKVAWSKVKGATGYTVYRSELVDGKWTKWSNRGTAKANKSSWVDKKVVSGVTYKYTVRAINGKVKSSYVETKGLLYLAQPTVTVKAVSNGINVAWSQCEGATGYTVYRSQYDSATNTWSKWSNRGTAKADKTNWTDKKATKGVTYRYTVRAVNADTGSKSTYVASKNVTR